MIKSLKDAILFNGGPFLICYLILQITVQEEQKNQNKCVNLMSNMRNKLNVGRGIGARGKQVPPLPASHTLQKPCPRSARSTVSKGIFFIVTQKSFLITLACACRIK